MQGNFKPVGGSRESASSAKPEAEGKKLNDAVYLLHDPGPQPEVELVFIHSLRFTEDKDAYWTTWLARDGTGHTCWPATWLQCAEGFPVAARVLSLNYDSSVKKLATEGGFNLVSLGDFLLQQMYLPGSKIGQNNCPVVFVCHSFGGTVAKQIVLAAKDNLSHAEKAQMLLRNLKGFFFYATADSGSRVFQELYNVPSAPQDALLKCLEKFETGRHRLDEVFQELENSEEYKDEWKFFVAAESCDTVVNGRKIEAVKDASAKQIGNDDFVEIPNADHFTVCQPESKDSTSFAFLKTFVEGIHKDFPPVSSYKVLSRDLKSGSLLGKGLSGIVYETKWNGKKYARKDFLRVPSDIFEREAAVLVRLKGHPNVVHTYYWMVDKRSCSLVLEFMDGDLWNLARKRKDLRRKSSSSSEGSSQGSHLLDLEKFIEERKNASVANGPDCTDVGTCEVVEPPNIYPFDMPEVIKIIRQIAEGMKFLHDKKVAHGDLKPRNILVTLNRSGIPYSLDRKLAFDQVKVADFGLIETKKKVMPLVSSQARKLEMLRWKAPERQLDDLNSSQFNDLARADVYSFAVTCSQILTGEEPYLGLDLEELVKSIRNDVRPKLLRPECPKELSALISLCWNPQTDQRPTFDFILNDLKNIQLRSPTEGTNIMGQSRTEEVSDDAEAGPSTKQTTKSSYDAEAGPSTKQTTKSSYDAEAGPSTKRTTKSSCDAEAGPSTKRGERLCDGVYSLHEPERQPEMEMVFIHGLQLGDMRDAYWTTWLARDGSSDNCWPKTWLAAQYPKARILSISYDARLAFTSGTLDLYLLGETLAQEMVLSGVSIGQHGCPVVFVCHDLGGLIAKQIVVTAYGRFRGDRKLDNLLRNTKGFYFCETPHGGSELVKINQEIGRLNSAFESIKWRFGVIAATSYNWSSRSMIVEEPSRRYVGNDHVMQRAAVHFDVCKPQSERDTNYLHLIGFIEEVVADYKSSQAEILKLPSLIVGVDDKLSVLCEKLKTKPIIGIVGTGGMGKTTLSKVMYNSEWEHYESCSYLEDVKYQDNIVNFQKQLLRELCGEKWDDKEDLNDNLRKIQECIKTKKVLVVMDDVGTERNLKALHVDTFQNGLSGSKLVITCRNRAILKGYMSEGEIIEVGALSNEQAMTLFSHYAFHGFNAVDEIGGEERDRFEDEAVHIVKACGGLPLSIEVVGNYLREHNHYPGEQRVDVWKEVRMRLTEPVSFEGYHIEEKLWRTWRISYDGLADIEKSLFLDFACIFSDMEDVDTNTIIRICDNLCALQTLIDSSLIEVVGGKSTTRNFTVRLLSEMEQMPRIHDIKVPMKVLKMHDQVRNTGRWIVRGMGKEDSHKHLIHLWEKGEVQRFLNNNERSSTLEGLSLVGVEELWFRKFGISQTFTNMISGRNRFFRRFQQYPNLRLLNLSANGNDVVKYVLKNCLFRAQRMRWLCLDKTEIVKSHLETLDALFKELRVLQMRDCRKLRELPSSIGELTLLLELNLAGCAQLRSLPAAIANLVNLQALVLLSCGCLEELPASIGNLISLRELNLTGCVQLKILPPSIGNLVNLQVLMLQRCEELKILPESMGGMIGLLELHLSGCTSLRCLPSSLGNLVQLLELHLSGCTSLRCLPSSLGNLVQLKLLDLTNCGVLEEIPPGVGGLIMLESLYLGSCYSLHILCEFDTKMQHLLELDLKGCESLRSFKSLGNLHRLQRLDMDGCIQLCIPNLPDCVGQLSQIQYLNLRRCGWSMVKEVVETLEKGKLCMDHLEVLFLPAFPETGLPSCPQLKFLSLAKYWLNEEEELSKSCCESIGNLVQLQGLRMRDFACVPESLGNLMQLQMLYLENMTKLPGSLSKLVGLKLLCIYNLSCQELPDHVGDLRSLHTLELHGDELVELPSSLGYLPQLRSLVLWRCGKLERLPKSLGGLTQLQSLILRGCEKLERLPETLGKLTQLRSLTLWGCEKLEGLPKSFGKLIQLRSLTVLDCKKLEPLPKSLARLPQLQSLEMSECEKLDQRSQPARLGLPKVMKKWEGHVLESD